MAKVKLTQKYIDNPPPVPTGKTKEEHCDLALPGLLWEQRATNTEWGTFRLRYKNSSGKTSYAAVGRSCTISLAEARQKVKQLKAEIQLGADPQAAVKKQRKAITWSSYMETIYLPHVKAHLRSYKNLVALNTKYAEPELGHLTLGKISLETAQRLHRDMVDVHCLSPASADHMAKFLRQALNYAIRLDLIPSSSVSKIRLFNVDNREERLMSPEEVAALMVVLGKDGKKGRIARLVVKFLLLTGARLNEALHARWSDIDKQTRTWVIQATNSKSKRRRSVPLNDGAIAVLDELESEGKSEWVFTSSRGDGLQRMTTINHCWSKIREEAGLPRLRLHDLRHQFSSHLINSGRTLYEVQQILGHSDPTVTQRYAHLSSASLQEAANCASEQITAALKENS